MSSPLNSPPFPLASPSGGEMRGALFLLTLDRENMGFETLSCAFSFLGFIFLAFLPVLYYSAVNRNIR